MVLLALPLFAGCSLFVSLDGLTGDASVGVDATVEGAADTSVADTALDSPPMDVAIVDAGLGCDSSQGPTMVRVEQGLCIDSTEVTNKQYAAFLASNPSTNNQISNCNWNNSFVPSAGMPPLDDYPVAYIDWCDAYAYCAWAGKELCGKVGDGGNVPTGQFTDPAVSSWFRACTKLGTQFYPYGSTNMPGACNTAEVSDAAAPVKSFPMCEGPFPGLFDMVGNIKEWENSCSNAPEAGPNADNCRRRGGGFNVVNPNCLYSELDRRDHTSFTSGVRCCSRQ